MPDVLTLTPHLASADLVVTPHTTYELIPGLLPSTTLFPSDSVWTPLCSINTLCSINLTPSMTVAAVFPYEGDTGLVLTPLTEVVL